MYKIETNHGHHTSLPRPDEALVLSYEQRTKGRLKATTETGKDVGLFLERGKVLRDGDILETTDGVTILVKAKPEPLVKGSCDSWGLFARCCYHLGNRHVPLQIGDKALWIQADHILKDMLHQLGMKVEECVAPFMPEQGAYSGGHHHAH